MEHGHSYLIHYITSNNILTKGKTMIEIGSTREKVKGQQSTTKLASFCNENNIHFITVDMDPKNTEVAQQDLRKINTTFNAVCSKGEDYLEKYNGNIDFVYLDAFDFWLPGHSEYRKDRYNKYLGDTINDESCWKMHLECAQHLQKKMKSGGVIAIDDTWVVPGGYKGKGKTAVPYLIKHGYKQYIYQDGCVLVAP